MREMSNCFDCQKNSNSELEICSVNFHENIELAEEFFLHQKNYLELKNNKKVEKFRKIKSKKIKDKCCEKYLKKGKNCKKCPLVNVIKN